MNQNPKRKSKKKFNGELNELKSKKKKQEEVRWKVEFWKQEALAKNKSQTPRTKA